MVKYKFAENRSIFVGKLGLLSIDDLGYYFSSYGIVTRIIAPKKRGFAYVEFESSQAMLEATECQYHFIRGFNDKRLVSFVQNLNIISI